jgi:hypothetical protein
MSVSVKMTVLWDVAPCGLSLPTFQKITLPLKLQQTSTRLHDATSLKSVIFRKLLVRLAFLLKYAITGTYLRKYQKHFTGFWVLEAQ